MTRKKKPSGLVGIMDVRLKDSLAKDSLDTCFRIVDIDNGHFRRCASRISRNTSGCKHSYPQFAHFYPGYEMPLRLCAIL